MTRFDTPFYLLRHFCACSEGPSGRCNPDLSVMNFDERQIFRLIPFAPLLIPPAVQGFVVGLSQRSLYGKAAPWHSGYIQAHPPIDISGAELLSSKRGPCCSIGVCFQLHNCSSIRHHHRGTIYSPFLLQHPTSAHQPDGITLAQLPKPAQQTSTPSRSHNDSKQMASLPNSQRQ